MVETCVADKRKTVIVILLLYILLLCRRGHYAYPWRRAMQKISKIIVGLSLLLFFTFPLSLMAQSMLTRAKYDGGFFAIEKPQNWEIETAGSCSGFSYIV